MFGKLKGLRGQVEIMTAVLLILLAVMIWNTFSALHRWNVAAAATQSSAAPQGGTPAPQGGTTTPQSGTSTAQGGTTTASQGGTTTPPQPLSSADVKKLVDDDVDARIRYDQALVDKLVLLVSVYTAILSFLALTTAYLNRQDAKEQLASGKEALEKLKTETKEELDELQEEIRRDVPEVHRLHGRILEIMHELQTILPDEADWNDNDSYRGLTEGIRQEVQVSEFTVGALTIFNLERSPTQRAALANIDRALARFYIARHNTSPDHSEADFERARYYASDAIRLEPDQAPSYRLRGAIALGRFDTIRATASEEVKKQLLDAANGDLGTAISMDTDKFADAGAHYNQALVLFYRGELDEAISASRRSIQVKDRFSSEHREKYLADIYVNLGCFLARKAGLSAEPAKTDLSRECVQVFKDGMADFQRTVTTDRGLAALVVGLRREIPGDLSGLEPQWKSELNALLMPTAPEQRERDRAETYLRLGRFLGTKAIQSTDAGMKADLSRECVQVFRDGVTDLRQTAITGGGLVVLLDGLKQELEPGGSLNGLEQQWKDELNALLVAPAGTAAPGPGGSPPPGGATGP